MQREGMEAPRTIERKNEGPDIEGRSADQRERLRIDVQVMGSVPRASRSIRTHAIQEAPEPWKEGETGWAKAETLASAPS